MHGPVMGHRSAGPVAVGFWPVSPEPESSAAASSGGFVAPGREEAPGSGGLEQTVTAWPVTVIKGKSGKEYVCG